MKPGRSSVEMALRGKQCSVLPRRLHAVLPAVSVVLMFAEAGCGGAGARSTHATDGLRAASPAVAGAPPPTFAQTVDLRPVSGKVLAQLPSARSLAGSRAGFVLLSAPRQIPVGSVIDATAGVVRLTVATPAPARLQSGSFHGGIFQVLQNHADRGLTMLRIRDNRSRRTTCGLTAAGNPARRMSTTILGLLRGVATGQFRTVGQFAAATVRGTEWGVRDRCDGTLTVVQQGVVDVRDFRLRKNILVTAGHTYLAQAG